MTPIERARKLATEVGIDDAGHFDSIVQAFAEIAGDERERCAAVCEGFDGWTRGNGVAGRPDWRETAAMIAAAIRRGDSE